MIAYRNHPSILWWNVLNENAPRFDPKRPNVNEMTLGPYVLSSVLPQVHALDSTRPAIANDPIWHGVDNIWEPGKSKPSLPLVQDHYYQFTALENNEDSWEKIRQRKWGSADNPSTDYLAITEWGVNSSPDWNTLMESYEKSGLPQDAEDYTLYRKLRDMNVHYYEESGIREQGFSTFENIQDANREYVAWRYREQMALYWGNLHSVGHGLTSLDDSSYELSGVVDTWRNPKPVVFDTITELNRPLQINLWLRPSCLYAGDPIELDATLVNERQRLAKGTYQLKLSLIGDNGWVVSEKDYTHQTGSDAIEHLVTDSIPANVPAGRYHLTLELAGGPQELRAQRPVVIFEREPKPIQTQATAWVWERASALQSWLEARSIQPRKGDGAKIRPGDLILVGDADPNAAKTILDAVRSGTRAVVLQPEVLFHQEQTPADVLDVSVPISYSERMPALAEDWKPELRKIDWWGAPSAWGYTRTALALQHPFLAGLPQAKPLEAQPEYQRLAPVFTWVMNRPPASTLIRHAVRESSVAIDMPYSSDLFSASIGSGQLVLNSLKIVQHLGHDPGADILLENLLRECSRQGSGNGA